MSILNDAINIRGTRPRAEINAYLRATNNYFRLGDLAVGLPLLHHFMEETRNLDTLLKTFNKGWALSQHLMEIEGQLAVAVVKTADDLFSGECFPHAEFKAHGFKVARYLKAEAKRRDNLKKTGHHNKKDHKEAFDAKHDVLGGASDSTVQKKLLSLTRGESSKFVVRGGDGSEFKVDLPSRGQLSGNKKPLGSSPEVRVKIAEIALRYVADLDDGSLAFLPGDLDPELIAKGEFIKHRADLILTRKSIRDDDDLSIVSGDQMALVFDALNVVPEE